MKINSYSLNNSSNVTAPLTFKKVLVSLLLIVSSTYMSFAQPAAPFATAADNFTCTSFNANWQVVPAAISYYLDVSTDLSFATLLPSYNNVNIGNVLNYSVSGLSINTNYYYRVRAHDGSNISLNSNTILANTGAASAPNALNASNLTCTSFDANWNTSTGAIAYNIDISTSASFSSFVAGFSNLNVGNVTTINVTGLIANTTYYYRLRADNGCSTSTNSNIISVLTGPPVAPTALAASNFTCTSMVANWGTSPGATDYLIDISTDQNFSTFVAPFNNYSAGDTTSQLVTGLMTNAVYYYRVRAANTCATSLNSTTITVSTVSTSAPIAQQATTIGCSSADANWSSSNNAITYFLDVSTSPTFSTFVAGYNNFDAGNSLTHTIIGLSANTTYYYRIRSSNGCSSSTNSNTITFSTNSSSNPNAPTALAASNLNCNSLNANWTDVSGATGYMLDVSTSASFSTLILNNSAVGNVTSFNISGLSANTTYYYRIRTIDGCGTSLNSNTIAVNSSGADAPIALSPTFLTCNSFDANWSAVAGALSYSIDVSTDASFGTFITGFNDLNVGNVTTYNITGLIVNTTYYYRVRVTNSCATSASSNIITVSTAAPAAPIATAATNLVCSSFNANWNAVSGAIAYLLDVSTDASFATFVTANGTTYNSLNVGNTATYNITGLQLSTTYYYRLRAANGCTTSTNSNTITVNTTAGATLNSALNPPAICSGSTFSYTPTSGTSGTTFAWSRAAVAGISNAAASGSGNANEILTNTTANSINVTYVYSLTANGCTNPTTYSVVVGVNPLPTLSSSLTPPYVFTNYVFNYTPTSGTTGTTFNWTRAAVAGISNSASTGTGDPNEVLYDTATNAVNVTYVYTLTAGGCTNPTTYSVVVTVNTSAVWPGDANNDSLVNNIDLLSLGLYYSQTGPPRSTVDNTWQAYVADNWLTLQTNGQDIKHADCNGDGMIDNDDTLAINLNYSLTHAITVSPVTFHIDERATSDMYFVISSSAYTAGDWVDVELWLGSQATPLTGLYGIAFDIDYDATFVQAGTEAITYQPSWLGTPGTDVLTINQVDALANKAYGAITRTDQVGRHGYGKIADFKFQVKNTLISADTMHFAISSYMAIDSVGVTRTLTTAIDSIGVNPLSTSIQSKNSVSKVNIAPNPFASNTTISFNTEVKNATVKVIDVLGKEVKTLTFTGKQLTLEKGELKAGIYSVKIVSENKTLIATEKVVIQ